VAPVGYQPHDWQVGEVLPKTYLDGSFDIMWNARRLPRPGDNRRWVRVGKDALLAEDTGRVDLVVRRFYE
jgi:Ni/Co efflux regulator RcnB